MKLFISALLILFIVPLTLSQEIIVLGIAQDGGFPHIGCQAECMKAHSNPSIAKYVSSIAIADPDSKRWWLFDATPDMDRQLQYFRELTNQDYPYLPEGIFLTHAHIGHYTGLMFLGREAMGAKRIKVHALEKMTQYLQSNGPWSQLVKLENITLKTLSPDLAIELTSKISVTAFTVPHRDEFSETAGYQINFNDEGHLFIPDIDKWDKWERNIVDLLKDEQIKNAFLDASFYSQGELPNRSMNEVPHPFVTETMKMMDDQHESIKNKIKFIHLNHTNPLLFDNKIKKDVIKKGYGIAEQGKAYK